MSSASLSQYGGLYVSSHVYFAAGSSIYNLNTVSYGENVFESPATAAQGGGVYISSNMYVVGFSSAAKYYGDGSGLFNVRDDGLGNHIATTTLNMATFNIIGVSSITVSSITTMATGVTFSTNIFVNGSIGIGTTTPRAMLHMDKPAETGVAETLALLRVSDAESSLKFSNLSTVNGEFRPAIVVNGHDDEEDVFTIKTLTDVIGTETGPMAVFDSSFLSNPVTRPLFEIRNYGNPKFTVLGNGRIGIGLPSPQANLHISSTTALPDQDMVRVTTGTANADVFVIKGSGKVGIGTMTPTGMLDVAGNINTLTRYQINGSTVLALLPGNYSLGLGIDAGKINTGTDNIFAGYQAGYGNAAGSYNAYLGSQAGLNATGNYNLFAGYQAGINNTGEYNVTLGHQAGAWTAANSGTENVFVGRFAGFKDTFGNYNAFVGAWAGYANTSASNNAFMGYGSGMANDIGEYNSFFGKWSGQFNTAGHDNSFIGYQSADKNTTGSNNVVIGNNAAFNNQTGSANAIFGEEAGYGSGLNSFSSSTIMGYMAGFGLTTGSDNILLGFQAGDILNTGSRNIIIGYDQDAPLGSSSYFLNIGGAIFGDLGIGRVGIGAVSPLANLHISSTTALYSQDMVRVTTGTLNADAFVIKGNGDVGIGTTSPSASLDVNGTVRLAKHLTQTIATDIVFTAADFGKTIVVDAAVQRTFTLPSPITALDIGAQFTIVKLGTGKVIIQAPAGHFISDSAAAGTISNDSVSPQYAAITLRLVSVSPVRWMLVGGEGSWVTQ
ncbi:MAG TPA: hypothetical protein DCL44_04140 [Elusimicrobia bacterium]|nr:hypothetical protein [Elusimicrobiota bacterium]